VISLAVVTFIVLAITLMIVIALVVSIALSLFVFAERLESPAPLRWSWRGPGKALRIVAAQARIRLAPWNRIGEASP